MEEIQSLDRWRLDIKRIGKKHWLAFYDAFMGQPVSSPMRLYRAINLYSDWPVFEAIVDCSVRDLSGDKLNYVLKVAHEKWKAHQQQTDAESEYSNAIEKSKAASIRANKALEKKIAGKRGKSGHT